ncbi:MAG: FecR domain-containing protein [Patescibacteria group bacterium]
METNTPNVEPQTSSSVLPRVIFFAFIAIVLALFWYFTRPEKVVAPVDEQGAASTSQGGNITLVQGSVEYKSNDGTWQRAEKGTVLKEGDSVEVIGSGRAIIALEDGSSVRLGDNSSAVLTGVNEDIVTITNSKGVIYTRVAKSTERIFDVVVGDKTYEAMGTAYKTINNSNTQGVEVYESKVKILGGNEAEVLVEQGNKYYVVNKKDVKLEEKVIKITSADVAKDEFVKWNNTIDKDVVKIEETTTTEVVDETVKVTTEVKETEIKVETATGIVLSGKATADGIYLNWSVNGISTPNGFKLVRSTGINPVYPGNEYVYLSNASARNYTWKMTDGKSYYFRVCKYIDGVCKNYSNNLLLKAPYVTETTKDTDTATNVSSIYVVGSGSAITWRTTGESPMGFKLVWSMNTHPTYPTRDGDKYNYYSDPAQSTGSIDAFSGSGTYYVRVCEYLGGACGVYSNEIQVTL